MVICNKQGCEAEAIYALTINVPAKGWSIALHKPVQMICSLKLCLIHYDEIKLEDWLDDRLKEIFMTLTRHRAQPDFSRAFKARLRLDSKTFRDFERQQAETKRGKSN